MAITAKTIINFYGSSNTVTNETANNINDSTTTGTPLIGGGNLVDVNNAATDVSISTDLGARTAFDGGGRSAGADVTDQEINIGGIYRQVSVPPTDILRYTLDFPVGQGAVNIDVYLCTTFPNQTDFEITAQGSNSDTVTGFDSTNNTTGVFASLSDITPDASNQIVITATNNNPGNIFCFWNGIVLNPAINPPITGTGTSDLPAFTASGAGVVSGNVMGMGSSNLPALTASGTAEAVGTISGSGVSNLPSFVGLGSGSILSDMFTDYFVGDGPFAGWIPFNDSALPNAQRVNDQYNSGEVSNANVASTTWFNADRGRADWKLRPFPTTGTDEYILFNVGVGPVSDPSLNLPYLNGGQFAFAGLICADENTSLATYEFSVIGHRGSDAESTFENKRTVAGSSNPISDEGDNAVGIGVTHADIRLRLNAGNTIDWAYRAVGTEPWTPIQEGLAWEGSPGPGSITFSSNNVYIGIITYGFGFVPAGGDFVGTADAAVLLGEIVVPGSGLSTLPALTSNGSGVVTGLASGSGSSELPAMTASGSGVVTGLSTGFGLSVLPSLFASGAGNVLTTVTASGNSVLPAMEATGLGGIPGNVAGVGAYTLPALQSNGTAQVSGNVAGVGFYTLPSLQAQGANNQPSVSVVIDIPQYETEVVIS